MELSFRTPIRVRAVHSKIVFPDADLTRCDLLRSWSDLQANVLYLSSSVNTTRMVSQLKNLVGAAACPCDHPGSDTASMSLLTVLVSISSHHPACTRRTNPQSAPSMTQHTVYPQGLISFNNITRSHSTRVNVVTFQPTAHVLL